MGSTTDDINGVYNWTLNNDIVFFSELRSDAPISVPGYHVFMNPAGGGMAALIRNDLALSLVKMDVSIPNQCWVELQCTPGLAIVGCYFPPPATAYCRPLSRISD